MGSAIYAQSQGQSAGGAEGAAQDASAGQEQKADEDVVEAEIVDDEPKKDK